MSEVRGVSVQRACPDAPGAPGLRGPPPGAPAGRPARQEVPATRGPGAALLLPHITALRVQRLHAGGQAERASDGRGQRPRQEDDGNGSLSQWGSPSQPYQGFTHKQDSSQQPTAPIRPNHSVASRLTRLAENCHDTYREHYCQVYSICIQYRICSALARDAIGLSDIGWR